MSNELISVVVPCGNLDGYLRKCIDSILGQTYKNIEIIAIDDGSTDKTSGILAEYAAADCRVVFIRQTGKGGCSALNAGIDIAQGAFLAFVDNNDWIEPDMYEKLHTALKSTAADMSVCNYNLIFDSRSALCYADMHDETANVYDDPYGYFCRYCACQRPNNYTWTRLYKSEIIKKSGIRFEYFRLGTDTLFNFKLLPLLRRVTFIKEGLYNYMHRGDSTVYTAAYNSDIAAAYADSFDALVEYYAANGFNEFLRVLPIHAFSRLRSIYFYSRLAGKSEDEIMSTLIKGFKDRKISDYLTGAVG